ncbi:unnamed protein product [Phytomonas sp. EM1]|nr:unnamed protein product [Phytomonas sp. EM1]|eukprot:CCW60981.1 unnamed protein product [Phytomonas sp. isolate EM1]
MFFDAWLRPRPDLASVDIRRYAEGLEAALKLMTASAFNCTFALMVTICVLTFVASQVTGNFSWMDRIWPGAPIIFAWTIVYYTMGGGNPHGIKGPYVNVATVYASFITLWGVRLAYNFYRRGGYCCGGEDYRWDYVRTWRVLRNRVVRALFNLFLVSIFQSSLLWAITLPMLSFPADALTRRDGISVGFLLFLLFFEVVCDQQQWNFQNAKRRRGGKMGNQRSPPLCGFCVTGVFGYSRHLNLFCEALIWVTLAVAAHSRQGSPAPWQWWQGVGCLMLVLLIYLSARFITERLSLKKYPQYAVYQHTTPMLVPALRSTTARTLYLIQKTSSQGAKSNRKQQ